MRGEDENVERNKNLVAFNLRGPRYDKLVEIAKAAVKKLEAIPGLSSVSTGLESAPEQIEVVFEQDLAERMGVTPEIAFNNIAWALRGWRLPQYQEAGREVPLIIEYDSEEIAGLDTLREMQIFTGESAVPLATVANLDFTRGQTEIYRRNGMATITLSGRVDDPTRTMAVTHGRARGPAQHGPAARLRGRRRGHGLRAPGGGDEGDHEGARLQHRPRLPGDGHPARVVVACRSSCCGPCPSPSPARCGLCS